MAREIFVDTGAWVALVNPKDTYHSVSVTVYPRVLRQRRTLVTTNPVIAEAYNLIRYRVNYAAGMRFLEILQTRVQLERVHSDAALEADAEQILHRYADQRFSYTDAVSFALMRRRGITEAFAFDRHFLTMRFTLLPGTGS